MRRMGQRLIGGMRKCKKCGNRMLFQGYNENNNISLIMEKECVCYECAYWMELIRHPIEYMEIIGHTCYQVCPAVCEKDRTDILGGKGRKRYFVRPDRTALMSNDIWVIGAIPKRFRSKLKPTLAEITKSMYEKLLRNNKRCKARGCYDRYHCWRYDLSIEKDKGPFNAVPPTWVVGDEHCRSFIGFENIINQ